MGRGIARACALLVFVASTAAAHEWYGTKRTLKTDLPCCNGEDCFEVTQGEFSAWMHDKNSFNATSQNSDDSGFHICRQIVFDTDAMHWDFVVRCAFEPEVIGARPGDTGETSRKSR